MIVVIDTNVMLPLFARNAQHGAILRALIAGRIRLALSQSILSEYEEILYARIGQDVSFEPSRAFSFTSSQAIRTTTSSPIARLPRMPTT